MMREPGSGQGGYMSGAGVRPWTRWQNWVDVVLGIILFIAPWVTGTAYNLGIPADAHAAWNNWIVGAIIALVALWALAMPRSPIPEGVNIVAAIWLFIAPWVLGYSFLTGPAWTDWIIAILVVIMAGWAMVAAMRAPSVPAA